VLVWIFLLFEISFNLEVLILVLTATSVVLKIYLTNIFPSVPVALFSPDL